MDDKHSVLMTFAARAHEYESESPWVSEAHLIDPLVSGPFGSMRLLDACAGTALIGRHASSLGWLATAADVSLPMLTLARDRVHSRVCCSVENLPFGPRAFDLVACRQGLQYVDL